MKSILKICILGVYNWNRMMYSDTEDSSFESAFNQPTFLFLEGVFKKDCLVNAHTSNKVSDTDFIVYDELPKLFYGLTDWPKSCNLHCWHCSLTFDTVPVTTLSYIEPEGRFGFIGATHGVFCSFPCASSFIDREYSILNDRVEAHGKLRFLYSEYYGTKMPSSIPPAPRKTELRKYGGKLSEAQFKEVINSFKIGG